MDSPRGARDHSAEDGWLRLVMAAEALIATKGFDVSDRQIIAASGHRNNSALAYHFGTRTALVEQIWYLHSAPVNLHRADMMAVVRAAGAPWTTRQLVGAHVLPFVGELRAYTPSYWARFNQRQLELMPTRFTDTFESDLDDRDDGPPLRVLSTLLREMERHLEHLSADEAAERVALVVRFIIDAFAAWERDCDAGLASPDTLRARADAVTDLAVAMLDTGRPADQSAADHSATQPSTATKPTRTTKTRTDRSRRTAPK